MKVFTINTALLNAPDTHTIKTSDSLRISIISKYNLHNLSKSLMKKIIYVLLVFLSFFTFDLLSQPVIEEWVRRYPDTVNGWGGGNAITVDNKGYVYITGTIVISNLMKYGTIKYSENGQVMWTRIYEGTNSGGRQPYAIAVDGKGNVFVTGYGYQTGNYFDFLTIKYDSLGNEKWVRFHDGGAHDIDEAVAVRTDGAGNIYVSGYTSTGGNHFVYCTIKYNTEGDVLWVKYYGIPTPSSQPFAIAVDDNSNIYVTGMNNDKATTISYDSAGNIRWSVVFAYESYSYSIAVDKNYNTYICGTIGDSLINGNDYLTIKYSPSGEQLWVRKYTYCNQWGECDSYAHTIAVDKSGNVYVNGKSKEGSHQNSICTIKYSNNGDSIWVRRSEHVYIGTITAMVIDSLNNVYVTAAAADTTLYNNITTYFTLSYNSSGSIIWTKRYNGNPLRGSISQCLAVDVIGNVYVSGLGRSEVFPTYDMTTVRYSQPLFGIKKTSGMVPQNFKLYQNYPNPFNPITKIKFDIPSNVKQEKSNVKLIVFDVLGREIEVLVNEELKPDIYEIEWNAKNYPSGLYLYKLTVGNYTETKKMVLIK